MKLKLQKNGGCYEADRGGYHFHVECAVGEKPGYFDIEVSKDGSSEWLCLPCWKLDEVRDRIESGRAVAEFEGILSAKADGSYYEDVD